MRLLNLTIVVLPPLAVRRKFAYGMRCRDNSVVAPRETGALLRRELLRNPCLNEPQRLIQNC